MASRASSLTRRTPSSSASRLTVSRLGCWLGIRPAVVGEVALDQHGGQAHVAGLEAGVALAQPQGELAHADSTLVRSLSARDGTSTDWPSARTVLARQVAHRQPVGVGGHQAQPALLGGHQHAGEDGAGVVGRRGRHHLAQRVAELGGVDGDAVARRLGQPGELVDGEHPQGELGAAGGDAGLLAVDLDLDRARRQGAHDVGHQPGGQHRDAVLAPVDALADVDRDGQLEVVAGQGEGAAGSSALMPASTGSAPPRLAVARPAVPRASTRTSRSHRNFTPSLTFSAVFGR